MFHLTPFFFFFPGVFASFARDLHDRELISPSR